MGNFTLFSQIISLLPKENFKDLVESRQSDKHCKGLSSWNHLVAMLFCQFSKADGLRDICNGLMSTQGNLTHLGIYKVVKRSTLCYQNQHRCWELFKDLYMNCKKKFFDQGPRPLRRSLGKLKRKIYMLDASLVSVCLNSFDWAHYRQCKGALKLHMLLDYDGCLPAYMHLTDGKHHESRIAKDIPLPKGSVVVADRGYLDFNLMQQWNKGKIFFVVRCKDNTELDVQEESLCGSEHILTNRKVVPALEASKKKYEGTLREVQVYDAENDQTLRLLTNSLTWTAETVAELYKQRWSIEIFFRDIKTHLKIKSFIGTSENAVLIQIWTALIAILFLKYMKFKAKYEWALANLACFIRIALLSKIELMKWLDEPFIPEDKKAPPNSSQLLLEI